MYQLYAKQKPRHRLVGVGALVVLMLGMFACGANQRTAPMDIDSFSLVSSISAGMPLQKAVFHPQSGTVYAMSSRTQEISIFRDTERINVIGGLGTGATNFQGLSDIAVGSDGSLLALDSALRTVKMFNNSGKSIGSLELKGSVQPTMLAVNSNQSLYVYDAAPAEIILYSSLDGTEQFRFGKFELGQIKQLTCSREFVVAYDEDDDVSSIFSSLGQFVKKETGQSLYDDYNNGLNLQNGMLISQMSPASLTIGKGCGLMNISRDMLVLVFDQEIRMLKIGYQQVR